MRKNFFILSIILLYVILFITTSWSKGPTHPSLNTFGHSTPGNSDTSTAWFQFMNEHIDWQTTGKDWYFPHYTRNQPVGAYWNIHHNVDKGSDYYNIKSFFESRGFHFEEALAHWKDNTAQTFEGKTYFRPGWDWANDSNSDRIRDYPSDYASQNEFTVGTSWVYHPGRNWSINQWQNDYLRLGWWDNGDTVSFIVSRNSSETLFVSGTIPSQSYVYYLVDDINAPNHNAVAQAESLAHILVYFTSQIAFNIVHPEVKHWGGHYCADLLRERRQSYSGALAIFHDNIWNDLPGSKIGRASYASIPHFGGTMLETELQTNFQYHFKLCLEEIKDSINQNVSGEIYLEGNVGNYTDALFDTLLSRCDGVWYERWTGLDQILDKFNLHKATVERHQAMGKYTYLNMCGDGELIGMEDRDKMFSLASYYITYDDKSYYLFDTSPNYGVRLADTIKWWYGLMSVDIGSPTVPAYTILSSSIWRRDFTKGMVLFKPRPGSSSNYTDSALVSLGGYYYRLDSQGRRSPSDSINQVYIKNAEGIILLNTGEAQSYLYPPQPLYPQNGATVDTAQPTLVVQNTQDPEGRPLLYYFEIDSTAQFNSESKSESTPFELEAGDDSTTRWTVPTPLSSGVYYWRGRAYTNTYPSDTSQFSQTYYFQLSTAVGDSLFDLYLFSPVGNELVVTLRPSLNAQFVHNHFDRDRIKVKFELSENTSFSSGKTTLSPLIDIPEDLTIAWTLDRDLKQGRNYFWRINVYDSGILLGSSDLASFQTGSIHIFPNPFKPSKGDSFITFRNIPLYSSITITTLSGELVRELSTNTSTDVIWDVKNQEGKDLASGVYYYRINFPSGSASGKLAVIR